MLLDAARRLLLLLVAIGGGTALCALALGAALGAPARRSISVGLYSVGCFLLVAGFVLGNRGPLRLRGPEAAGGLRGARAVRRASVEEREDAPATVIRSVGSAGRRRPRAPRAL